MPLAGFEPTIPVFKRAKAFHALDRAATVTGPYRQLRFVKRPPEEKTCPVQISNSWNSLHDV
jgi:hypothetical protein